MMTPLHLAAFTKNIRIVRQLLQAGADASLKSDSKPGNTAQDLAELRGATDIIKLLEKKCFLNK